MSTGSLRFWRIGAGILVLALACSGIVLLARPHSIQSTNGKLRIVAGENFWGDIAGQIGGTHVQVTSIITDPNADPHLYESNAQNASTVAQADVVIVNGLGYDDFMTKLLGNTASSDRAVLSAAQLMHAPDGANPHLWYDIPHVSMVATTIADTLEAKDPKNTAYYQHNVALFNQSLLGPENTIAQIRQKYAGAPVAYTEPVPAYLLAAARLDNKTPEGFAKSIADGNDPNPADTQAMDARITHGDIKVLLCNTQASSPVTEAVKSLARQHGIPVVGITETMPAGESYQTWQQNQLQQLLQALGGY
ncbi:MAG TPA: zinc ABC transporter substrate-binding protein [Candidatus Saccharimonadales bacterium]|nr:zinc ABC transporter substrate-binding protein [Candidatus Saccharimonadales bacterium]